MNATTKLTASLGSGSYDYDALKAATDAVHASNDEDKGSALAEAVAATDRSPARDADPRATPGYSFRQRKGPTGQMERIQVAEGAEEAPGEKPKSERKHAPKSTSGQRRPESPPNNHAAGGTGAQTE